MTVPWTRFSRRDLVLGGGTLFGLSMLTGPLRAQAPAADGFRSLRARPGQAWLRGPDRPPSAIWGFDGAVPGPTIRVTRGEEARLRLINDLPEATALHWHGVRISNAMDGAPHLTQPPVAPGASFDYRFACPDAGTFWYRASHPWLAQRGLSGLLLVEEVDPIAVDQDIALMLADWRAPPDGSLANSGAAAPQGAAGQPTLAPHLTANGVPRVDIPVRTNERIRLRLVNAAEGLMSLRLDRHRATVMALDGQPAEPFTARDNRIFLGPGNRADLFVDATLEGGASAPITVETEAGVAEIARLAYAAEAPVRAMPLPDPAPLPANPLPARMDFAGALKLDVPIEDASAKETVWSVRNSGADRALGRSLLSLKRGRTVMLAFVNRTAAPAVLHVHGHAFRLLDRLDDGWKPFWLDTLVVPQRQTLRIAFLADNPGKWMIECGTLGDQPAAMAAWFEVT